MKANTRPVAGELAQNFIGLPRFDLLFKGFRKSILSNLKHLYLCEVVLQGENEASYLAQTLNSFCQLEKLDIFNLSSKNFKTDFELNLPMLKSLQFDNASAIKQLTLDAPKLKKAKLTNYVIFLKLKIVHAKSVEEFVGVLLKKSS